MTPSGTWLRVENAGEHPGKWSAYLRNELCPITEEEVTEVLHGFLPVNVSFDVHWDGQNMVYIEEKELP